MYEKEIEWWKQNQGKMAKCKVTGFEGVVTAMVLHLYGCNGIGLTPRIDKDGNLKDTRYLDEGRIEILEDVPGVIPEEVKVAKPGCGDSPKTTYDL